MNSDYTNKWIISSPNYDNCYNHFHNVFKQYDNQWNNTWMNQVHRVASDHWRFFLKRIFTADFCTSTLPKSRGLWELEDYKAERVQAGLCWLSNDSEAVLPIQIVAKPHWCVAYYLFFIFCSHNTWIFKLCRSIGFKKILIWLYNNGIRTSPGSHITALKALAVDLVSFQIL